MAGLGTQATGAASQSVTRSQAVANENGRGNARVR